MTAAWQLGWAELAWDENQDDAMEDSVMHLHLPSRQSLREERSGKLIPNRELKR